MRSGEETSSNSFDRFTERARIALTLAQEEAQRFNNDYIGSEHLLLGLVADERNAANVILSALRVNACAVRTAVERFVELAAPREEEEIGLSADGKNAIELAADEARRLGHGYIGTEHLLLGLVRDDESIATRALVSLGINIHTARAATILVLTSSSKQHSSDPLRIFLCHAHGDKPEVRQLYRWLRSLGTDPWLDEKSLLPGQDWDHEIRRVIREMDVVLVCLSRAVVTKTGYVQKEIRFALNRADEQPEGSIFVIPTRIEDCEVPRRLAHWHIVDLFASDGHRQLIRALQKRAKAIGKRTPSSSEP